MSENDVDILNNDENDAHSPKKVKAQRAALEKKKMEQGENFKYILKTPKGTRDFGPEQMAVREKVLGIITETFKRHGAVTIDTPVFELREVLMGKYGEEGSKLVYNLEDQGGELCSLRYDLTVPFARYLASNKVEKIKRYQIAKVYRRDQPVMTKGRYREFYQCDFDIAGQGELMVQEAECLKIVDEVLTKLDLGDFEIRINHRQLLDGMFAASGIPEDLFKTVSSSVDKLDKQPWSEVRGELIKEKGIPEPKVDALGGLVRLRDMHTEWDNSMLLDWFSGKKWMEQGKLSEGSESAFANIKKGVDEMKLLLHYAELFGCKTSRLVFHPSLARGLDYYTGIIYEVVMKEFSFNPSAQSVRSGKEKTKKEEKKPKKDAANNAEEEEESSGNLGSVAAGGRYDKLVGMFLDMGGGGSKGNKKRPDVPCIGVSFGIERLFAIMEMKMRADSSQPVRISPTQIYVASIKSGEQPMLQERMRVCAMLWEAGIRAETSYKANPKILEQIQYCEQKEHQINWLLILGAEELAQNSVKLRCVRTREETLVKSNELISVLRQKLALQTPEESN